MLTRQIVGRGWDLRALVVLYMSLPCADTRFLRRRKGPLFFACQAHGRTTLFLLQYGPAIGIQQHRQCPPYYLPSRPPRPILAQPYGRRLYVRLAGSVMTPHWLLHLSFSSLSHSTGLLFTVSVSGKACTNKQRTI